MTRAEQKARKAEQKAREMISNLTLPDLLDEWELTTNVKDPNIYTVRGWLMDELEKRNPEAFDKWLESETCEDSELKYYMMEN